MERPPTWTPPRPLPGPILTPRLRLDWFVASDAASLFRAVSVDRASLIPWLPWARSDHRTEEESLARIDKFARARSFVEATDFTIGIFDRASGDVLGGTGFHRIDVDLAAGEVGYWLRADARGRGLCTEAVAHLASAAFTAWGLRRLLVRMSVGNEASRRVPERLAFRLECREHAARWHAERGWDDELGYAVLRDEWDVDRHAIKGARA